MQVDVNKVFVTYMDAHFILIYSEDEEAARRLEGKILGHYLSGDKAREALDTMKTIAHLGYGGSLTFVDSPTLEARRALAADAAFCSYEFGMVVEAANGWRSEGDRRTRTFFVESGAAGPSLQLEFEVRFEAGSAEVVSAYVIH